MAQVTCNITLDVSMNDGGKIMMAKQGDSKSRLLCVHLTDQGSPLEIEAEASVLLNVFNGSEARSFRGATVGGAALFALPDFALESAGSVSCDVSVLGSDGGKLTSASFEICVAESVCPQTELGSDERGDLASELLAQSAILELEPTQTEGGWLLEPAVNRRYSVDLSNAVFKKDGAWLPITLRLPTPKSNRFENWILLYCHAPLDALAGAVTLGFEAEKEPLFESGKLPYITAGDLDVVCSYSPVTGKWQIGVIQYKIGG